MQSKVLRYVARFDDNKNNTTTLHHIKYAQSQTMKCTRLLPRYLTPTITTNNITVETSQAGERY